MLLLLLMLLRQRLMLLLQQLLLLLLLLMLTLLLLLVRVRGGSNSIHCQKVCLGEAQLVDGQGAFRHREKA